MTKNWGVKIEIGNDAPRSDDWITVNLDENVKPTIKAPATEIPLEDESADLIYASHILEHLNYGSRHPSVHAAL
jgi:predicted SAM-dependent methyltransferase